MLDKELVKTQTIKAQITAADKTLIYKIAAEQKISVGELIRRALKLYISEVCK